MTKTSAALFAATLLLLSQAATAAGDAANGGRLFLQCRACHTVGPADRHGVGPNLNGVVGAKAGAKAGYSYSPALAKKPVIWNAAALDAFLAKPMTYAPGTKMAFAGVAKPQARADIIAYLATLKPAKR